jgi:hypothetical protein
MWNIGLKISAKRKRHDPKRESRRSPGSPKKNRIMIFGYCKAQVEGARLVKEDIRK